MTTELASDPLLEIALSIHGSTKCLYQNYVDDSGTAGMFTIVQETTFDAARLEGVLVHFNDVIESGEQVLAEERESLGQTLINHLAAVCAGEYFFHSNSPDIMKLSQEVLLLWPGQPLRNFGHSGPVLEGAYWFVNSVRHRCTREIAAFGQFIAGDEDVPRQLAEGLDRLIENIPRVQQFGTFVSEEEYC